MRRPDGTAPTALHPGDWCLRGTRWWVCDPGGVYYPIDESRWVVQEHKDGTITVTPSLDRPAFETTEGVVRPWHGWLTVGTWVTA